MRSSHHRDGQNANIDYCIPNIPFGLQNLATVFREATESKIITESEKGLDSLLLIGQEYISEDLAAPATDQVKAESEEGDPTNSSLTIKPTLEGQTIHRPNDCEELPYQVGPPLSPPC